ncbi:YbhB/YbcL family Raf kinase inhibitor-like protein [Acidianus brierleyi]|uniref:YbhB/YbcL family Raf kinase inhibitor-like protein n=1 Tax=Acidianus brierleyi TaxID=41673 RepID=A0A2U9IF29_9CREN|nr:YbhB/YbcL family Raf kinase inhibitor-like protein [Acidianus brierleyi]AWR94600.1 YbhB/YbcL family Raf kinase inhibitor-like protein [Acidianus brierleyi]
MEIRSAFTNGEEIPIKYTCDGIDISPPLEWEKIDNAKTYAIIVEDPDAPGGTFIHWVIYNIKRNSLPENVKKEMESEIGIQGVNDFGKIGYNGPCPPKSHGPHRYYFNVYALDSELPLRKNITADNLKSLMENHIISAGNLMGKYKRK